MKEGGGGGGVTFLAGSLPHIRHNRKLCALI